MLDGDMVICDRLFVTNQGVILFLLHDKTILLPMSESDAHELRSLCQGGHITRIDVNAGYVTIKPARLH
jgi:hypothetical protein